MKQFCRMFVVNSIGSVQLGVRVGTMVVLYPVIRCVQFIKLKKLEVMLLNKVENIALSLKNIKWAVE
jgi:hypothetical protein